MALVFVFGLGQVRDVARDLIGPVWPHLQHRAEQYVRAWQPSTEALVASAAAAVSTGGSAASGVPVATALPLHASSMVRSDSMAAGARESGGLPVADAPLSRQVSMASSVGGADGGAAAAPDADLPDLHDPAPALDAAGTQPGNAAAGKSGPSLLEQQQEADAAAAQQEADAVEALRPDNTDTMVAHTNYDGAGSDPNLDSFASKYERILRLLEPGDEVLPQFLFNCARIEGLDKHGMFKSWDILCVFVLVPRNWPVFSIHFPRIVG